MPARRLNDITIVAATGVAIAVLAAAGAIISPAPVEGDERGSSFSAGPLGARAAYLTLGQGYRVARSLEPVTAVTHDPRHTVLVLASPSSAPSDQDRRALQRFIERGGIVLASGAIGADFLGGHAEEDTFLPSVAPPTFHAPEIPSPLSAGARPIAMRSEVSDVHLDAAYVTVYGSDPGGVVRTARVGAGRAIWWAGSSPLSNGAIAESGNLELLMNALGPREARVVLWDEHYHGHARSLWSYTTATPLGWGLAQFGLMAAAALATYSRRRGPVRPKVVDARTSPMEFVETLGGLYEQARAASASVAAAHARLRRLLLAATGLPPSTSGDALARAVDARLGIPEAETRNVLAEAERAATDPSIAAAEGLAVVRRVQALGARLSRRKNER